MSKYYNPNRASNLFDPKSKEPFRLSRTKIDLFLNCPRCFYFDRRIGIAQPPGFPFSLNSAVDTLLKKEFDSHRAKKTAHPLMKSYGIDAVPFDDPRMDEWRDSLRRGITFLHKATNFMVTGGVDDVWVNPKGDLHIVDYKATAKDGEVSIDADWQIAYKRQMEVYQWLFRKNGFTVSDTGYFVYCNGQTDRKAFDGKLEFDVVVLAYHGKADWIDETLIEARACLEQPSLPKADPECDFCAYREATSKVEQKKATQGTLGL
jgi:CRISPR/Cas system-associated exonuclease Cas4 (RecB family)